MFWAAVSALVALAAHAEVPAIARPRLAGTPAAGDARGVMFFLESKLAPGMVAVGTAHTLTPEALARAQRVEFALTGSRTPVAVSDRYAVAPGRPFSDADAALRDDYMVFLLSSKPRGVRALAADSRPLSSGGHVRVLGPGTGKRAEQGAPGTITSATAERIEIQLDATTSLEGWGGAPVLADGRVIGILQAAIPGGTTTRVIAAPISGVLDALRDPLEGGKGRRFAAFAPASAAEPAATATPAKPAAAPRKPLIQPMAGKDTALELSIEYPRDGAEVSSTVCGTFVAGRARATHGAPRRFDVILVIDTSRSTLAAAGTDVNGNGVIGEPRLGGLGAMVGAALTDDGDSILAAEIAAARRVLAGFDPRSTRVGLVAFAGDPPGQGSNRKPAVTIGELTREYDEVERELGQLEAVPPLGNSTHMAAGVDQATIELTGLRGARSKPDPDSEKVVFFFTDGQPTLPYASEADNVRAVLRAATRAARANIRIHSFAIGPEALAGPIAAVEMASRTRGFFIPVRNPGDLVDIVEEVSFANIDKVTLEQMKTRAEAKPFRITADGSWAGFLALEPGSNTIRATAIAEEGTTAERRIQVSLVDKSSDTPEPDLPVDLVVQRNRLLEDCLLIARQQRLDAERERNEEIRRALQVEIERERQKARERADQQRKQLELEGEDEEETD
jgi:von Willebrand factor type A domain